MEYLRFLPLWVSILLVLGLPESQARQVRAWRSENQSNNTVVTQVPANPTSIATGSTFNGSTLSEFSYQASENNTKFSLTVLFVNNLNRSLDNLKMYDRYDTEFHPAPDSIPAKTKEVFSFYEPKCCFPSTTFSYQVPGSNVQIAAFAWNGGWSGFGLAFLPTEFRLKNYFEAILSKNNTEGPYMEWYQSQQGPTVFSLQVEHKRLQAKATMSRGYQSILTIEITERLEE